jgi:hypothetical protein
MKNINRDVKAMYFAGVPQIEIMEKTGVSKWQLTKMIDKLVKSYPGENKDSRLLQARLMEANLFDMIKKGKDVSSCINHFSSFCA